MARSHLTLAALATSAVPGLDVSGARAHTGSGQGDYDSAVLTASTGRTLIVRAPTGQGAESEQGADLVALRALTTGVRGRLPFDVPVVLGQAPYSGTRAVVYEYLPGEPADLDELGPGAPLSGSVGRSIAAVHSLPASFVSEAGLPVDTAADARAGLLALVEEAAGTGLLPIALRDRWRSMAAESELWQFQPTVVNGGLGAASFLHEGGTVTGVLGWSGLRVGDPAQDLHWLMTGPDGAFASVLESYAEARGLAVERAFTRRAALAAELEAARWLLHGREARDQGIVDDAVQMLDGLAYRVRTGEDDALAATGRVLDVDDVESLLARTPGDRAEAPGHAEGLPPVEEDPRSERPDDE